LALRKIAAAGKQSEKEEYSPNDQVKKAGAILRI
jgi:hypothetical protein